MYKDSDVAGLFIGGMQAENQGRELGQYPYFNIILRQKRCAHTRVQKREKDRKREINSQ